MSELLVGSVEQAAEAFHMNEIFVGVILVVVFLLLVVLWSNHRPATEPPPPATPSDPPPEEGTLVFRTNTVVRRLNFVWSQIESDDYATYIANLRRIGCPEPTVRDLSVPQQQTAANHRKPGAPGLLEGAIIRAVEARTPPAE